MNSRSYSAAERSLTPRRGSRRRTAEGMAMNQARVGLLVAAALLAMPLTASAQPKRPPRAQLRRRHRRAEHAPKGGAAASGESTSTSPQQPADKPPSGTERSGDGPPRRRRRRCGGLGDICKIDPTACPTIDMDKAAKRDLQSADVRGAADLCAPLSPLRGEPVLRASP